MLEAAKSLRPESTQLLLKSVRDPDPLVREWAVEGLVRRKAEPEKSVQALVGCLRGDERADVRWYAARALGKIGVVTDAARAALLSAVEDQDEFVRSYAAWALAQLQVRDLDVVACLRARLLAVRKNSIEAQSFGVALARDRSRHPGRPRRGCLVDLSCPELATHRRLLQKLTAARQPGQPSPWIFTTNYDLAIEWAAETHQSEGDERVRRAPRAGFLAS